MHADPIAGASESLASVTIDNKSGDGASKARKRRSNPIGTGPPGRQTDVARTLERWLETFDEKEVPNLERPIVQEEEQGHVDDAHERERNDIPVIEEAIPAQDPPRGHQPNEERQTTQGTPICPLCNRTMRLKPARKGGWFMAAHSGLDAMDIAINMTKAQGQQL